MTAGLYVPGDGNLGYLGVPWIPLRPEDMQMTCAAVGKASWGGRVPACTKLLLIAVAQVEWKNSFCHPAESMHSHAPLDGRYGKCRL